MPRRPVGIVTLDDEGFDDVLIEVLNDIAQANAIRSVEQTGDVTSVTKGTE